MINVKEALSRVLSNVSALETIEILVENSLGFTLAKDISSPIYLPPFNQSAMDGYAISGDCKSYKIIDEIKAGDNNSIEIKNGECVRIFTGSKTPKGTTAIAKQEIVTVENGGVYLNEIIKPETSIRKKGEEIKIGEIALKKQTLVNPAAIGLISSLGITKISVYKKPKIELIVTGNELTKPGLKLENGSIYESNSFTIKSALEYCGYNCKINFVKDDYNSTKSTIEKAIKNNDLVIITGGISVGDYDFVGKSLTDIGVTQTFYKVKQKPGKPLYFGIKGSVKIFALPGNPAAALSCFYIYVLTALKLMNGNKNPELEKRIVKISHFYSKKGDRAQFLKAKFQNGKVTVHKGQSSAMLSSFVDANCLLYIPEETNEVKEGSDVLIYILP